MQPESFCNAVEMLNNEGTLKWYHKENQNMIIALLYDECIRLDYDNDTYFSCSYAYDIVIVINFLKLFKWIVLCIIL